MRNRPLILFLALISIVAVIIFPIFDKLLNPASPAPSMITYLGVGASLTIITVIAVYFAVSEKIGFTPQMLFYFFLYNTVVVLVKFTFAPWALYDANKFQSFNAGFASFFTGSGNINPILLLGPTITIFFAYYIVLYLFYKYFRRKLFTSVNVAETHLENKLGRMFFRIGFIMLVGIVVSVVLSMMGLGLTFAGGALAVPFILLGMFTAFPAITYISYINSSFAAIFVVSGLLAAAAFVGMTYKSATEQAVVLRNAAGFSLIFIAGAAFLLAYHALWFLYILIVAMIWPLRTVVPK